MLQSMLHVLKHVFNEKPGNCIGSLLLLKETFCDNRTTGHYRDPWDCQSDPPSPMVLPRMCFLETGWSSVVVFFGLWYHKLRYIISCYQVAQKILRFYSWIKTFFVYIFDFLTFPCYEETKDSIQQMMSACFYLQTALFNNCIKLYWYGISSSWNMKEGDGGRGQGVKLTSPEKKLTSNSPVLLGLINGSFYSFWKYSGHFWKCGRTYGTVLNNNRLSGKSYFQMSFHSTFFTPFADFSNELLQRKCWSEESAIPEALAPRCSGKKLFLKILQNSQENICAKVSF